MSVDALQSLYPFGMPLERTIALR